MTCFPFLSHSKGEPSDSDSEINEKIIGKVKFFTYKELRRATDDFSKDNKIGEGGFGSVYKGRLKDGKIAAIKVLSAESKQGSREFLTEINVISKVEHENLVKLYGCCVQGDHRILVYNYLQNNSLDKTLLGRGHSDIQFDWETRYRICIGVAQGLAFLHEEVQPYIVHRDIKASNILLDEDLSPKISDFGLAKLIPRDMSHVSTRVAGTLGYLSPEYAMGGKLTRKADVYSFGVLLMEIVSGRTNKRTRFPTEQQNLLERAWELYELKELVLLVDASLNGYFDAEEAYRFLKIGLFCTQDSPKLRPSMSTAVKMLKGEKDIDQIVVTRPGLLTDFMDVKTGGPQKENPGKTTKNGMFDSSHASSSSGTVENSDVVFTGSSSGTKTGFSTI